MNASPVDSGCIRPDVTVSTDGTQDLPVQVNLKPIVELIENIFHGADGAFKATQGILNGAASLDDFAGMTAVLDVIHGISCMLSCNHSGDDPVVSTLSVLNMLKGYSCNARVVIVVAAFALIFGEFWLLVRHRTEDQFAKSLDLLRGYSHIADLAVLKKFLKAMTDAVKINFAFMEPPVCNILGKQNSMQFCNIFGKQNSMQYFHEFTQQIIHTVVRLSSILVNKVGYDIVQTISTLEVQVTKINVTLQEKLELCKTEGETHVIEQLKVICDLISSKKRIEIIAKFMGVEEHKVSETLRQNHVLFLISDLEISTEEINILKQFKRDSKEYEIIWLPIVDGNHKETKFTELESIMTSWTVVNPCNIKPEVIRYIKSEWHFIKKSVAVSLDAEGTLNSYNALPMLLTWGNSAFPFTPEIEMGLWNQIDEQDGWKLDFLITEQIDRNICSWVKSSDTFVCLFGGENTKWVQDFTAKVKEVTTTASVSLKLAYVGKNKGQGLARDKLGQDIHVIESEYRVQFWSRLESIFYSKIKLGKSSKTDCVMREVMKVLGYDGIGDGEWAIFAMGSELMVTTNGEMALTIMSNYNQWQTDAKGCSAFLQCLRTCEIKLRPPVHKCIHVQLLVHGEVPRTTVFCPECGQEMEMYYAYHCCP